MNKFFFTVALPICFYYVFASGSSLLPVFTSPSNYTIVAAGGIVPEIHATILSSNLAATACEERVNGQGGQFFLITRCSDIIQQNFSLTCNKLNESAIASTLTYTGDLRSDLQVTLQCSLTPPSPSLSSLTSIKIIVSECPRNIPSNSLINPTINATSYTYQSLGLYGCSSGQLFYNNGTVGVMNTSCLNSASWSGGTDLQCWQAPEPKLIGNFSVTAGSKISFECNILKQTYPPVSYFTFHCGTISKKLSTAFWTQTVTKEMNNQYVYCQVDSNYTKFNESLGLSPKHKLNVTYPPTISGIRANGSLIQYGTPYVLLQNTSITLTCDVDSNPNPTCLWSYDKLNATDHSCSVTRKFNISTNATCTAQNGVGEPVTKFVTIISVPVNRQPQIYVNGRTIINNATQPLNLSSNLNLLCSVDYEIYLNTSYDWTKQDVPLTRTSNLSINSATQNNTGYYVCNSSDEFGKFQSSVYIDVRYAPHVVSSMNCFQHQQCVIVVSSNPPPSNPVLLSPGNTSELLTWENFEPPYYTTIINKPHGEYFLKVTNLIGESSLKITIHSSAPTSPSNNVPMIIGLSVTGVVVILLIVLALFMFWKRRKDPQVSKASTGKTPQEAPVYMNTSLYENTGAITATATYQNTAEYQNVASEKITTEPDSTTAYETFGTN